MIKPETIDKIFREVRIEDVVGEFVNLKKRGVNLQGLCPFHQEKSPSFSVNAAKGIYKCFGCGKGGNAVNFIMEHENCSYPEALRWIAKRYNIEIEEDFDKSVEEAKAENKERESLLIALDWAATNFTKNLLETEEGQNIGLSYFEERGFRQDTIIKFGLGYCLNSWTAFHEEAFKAGYLPQYLEKAGLIKHKENTTEYFDFFRGRVMFPIHHLSGKIIGFGGRVLQKDAKTAKYLNSPESEVYHKSDVLYGIFQAKKSISQKDNCYLVEGYTDVITLSQAGIENVVASSGTSLTEGQIKLIKRFTENVTVLYDGDYAGIKASLRGIDMLLHGGLNVKVVMFPDGEDPDSYCKKVGDTAFAAFLDENKKDFIVFKSKLLLEGNEADPIKKVEAMRSVAESVAKISDHFKREVYIQECEKTFGFTAEMFAKEIAGIRRKEKIKLDEQEVYNQDKQQEKAAVEIQTSIQTISSDEHIERDMIRVLMEFGSMPFEELGTVKDFIFADLEASEVQFEIPVIAKIFELLKSQNGDLNVEEFLLRNQDPEVSSIAVNIISERFDLSPHWSERYEVEIKPRSDSYITDTYKAVNRLKLRKVDRIISKVSEDIKNSKSEEELEGNFEIYKFFLTQRGILCNFSGTVVVK